MYFDKAIVLLQTDCTSKEELLQDMANRFLDHGLVNDDFAASILHRETVFPTGLPTRPFGIAIPHTDIDKVKTSQIGFASLKKPIAFNLMGGEKHQHIEVSLVFMLALNNSAGQLDVLQKLIELFQDEQVVSDLMECTTQSRFLAIMSNAGIT